MAHNNFRVDRVKNQWLDKKMDLNALVNRIKLFFPLGEFEVSLEKVRERHVIDAHSKIPNLKLNVQVSVLGTPDDFIVEFSAGGESSREKIAGHLTTMFGGSYLISRGAKKRELLDRLEKDFWKHTQLAVADLAGSASHSNLM